MAGNATPARTPPICTPVCLSEKMNVRCSGAASRARISELAGVSIAQAAPMSAGVTTRPTVVPVAPAARPAAHRRSDSWTTRGAPRRAIRPPTAPDTSVAADHITNE